ncbi:hypothetical protein [Aminobacter carboxidus]
MTPDGRRFVNESLSYHDFMQGLTRVQTQRNQRRHF